MTIRDLMLLLGSVRSDEEYSEATPENEDSLLALFWRDHHRNLSLDC